MNTIEKNLYDFYRIFGSVKNVRLITGNGYELVGSDNESWPQMIFNLDQSTDPLKLVPLIVTEIEKRQPAPFFIAPEGYISRNHTELLKTNAIVPVKILKGMSCIPERKENVTLPPECEIYELIDDEQLTDFAHLIGKEFITAELSYIKVLLNGIKSAGEVQMTGLFYNKILVSSALILTKEGMAGLYFIVTRREFQNKGYASTLIRFILNRMYKAGVKEVVLHANNFSAGLYQKLGFEYQNNFVIYKKQ